MSLLPVQALGLYEAWQQGGLFGPIGVGEGKTLLTLLLPLMFECKRPLLLLPGGLIEKTQRERMLLSQHWRIPRELRFFSYDLLGRVQAKQELWNYRPDSIICDEVHRLKNRRAAVTRVMARYMHDFPLTPFCGVSGTVMDKSIDDFAHILIWALKLKAPVPTRREEIDEWAEAIDRDVDEFSRRKPGALLELCTPEERKHPPHIAARHGFRRRLTETPGVVATVGEGEHVDCSIYVRGIQHKVAPVTEWNFLHLRGDGTPKHPGWQTPDDWQLMFATDVWRHAQELALGLFYVWDPRPPMEWRQLRSEWNQFVRKTISKSRTFDSELHVANACDDGRLDDEGRLERWREIRPSFTPHVKPVWCDDSALTTCAEWMQKGGIVWTEHGFFAARLANLTGAAYYGAKGFSRDGRYIEDAKAGSPIIASIDANREGKNLQKLWSRNLIVCPPRSAQWCEQVIARTHRPGQLADEVTVDVLLGCRENFDAIIGAIEDAKAIRDTMGKKQKLLLADVTLPPEREIEALRSPRWVR